MGRVPFLVIFKAPCTDSYAPAACPSSAVHNKMANQESGNAAQLKEEEEPKDTYSVSHIDTARPRERQRDLMKYFRQDW